MPCRLVRIMYWKQLTKFMSGASYEAGGGRMILSGASVAGSLGHESFGCSEGVDLWSPAP